MGYTVGKGVTMEANSLLLSHVFSCNHKVDLSKALVIDGHPHTRGGR